ncbi:hypothetical protein [Anaerobacillus sp. 1_MG-2023]|uniref:hypothetical protein n=1 Tax=Anaerobacillus sp. 1_MG-2023 TaxID=3062655 RepID=UPI0026E360C6|nr:hypothetical protein [Anaerobacillus sp. 1_MG-2023]MDO6655213.1 hypothetical protein [Anaerobacillus sp. 1_MG-2023]
MSLRKELSHILYYVYDMVFVYLIISFFYLYEKTFPPILPFLTMVIGGGLVFFGVYARNRAYISFTWMLLLMVLTTLAGVVVLGFPFLYTVLLSIVIAWRSYINMWEIERSNDALIFFLSLIGAFLFFLFSNSSELRQVIFLLPLVQFVMLLICRTAVEVSKTGGKKQARWAISSIFILLSASSVLFSILIWVKEPIVKAISYSISGLGYVIGLPIYWITSFLEGRFTEDGRELLQTSSSSETQEIMNDKKILNQGIDIPIEMIFYTLLFICFVIVAIVLYKKRLALSRFQVKSFATSTSETVYSHKDKQMKQSKPPSDQIRKQLYDLEIKAFKYRNGRQKDETLSEWLRRIPGSCENKKYIIKIYENVRYGEKDPDHKEALLYKKHVKNLLHEVKFSYKLEKRKEN